MGSPRARGGSNWAMIGLSHQPADGGEDVPLAVVDALGHHGAVEVEEDAVQGPRRLDAREHVAEDLVEDGALGAAPA